MELLANGCFSMANDSNISISMTSITKMRGTTVAVAHFAKRFESPTLEWPTLP